MRQWEREESDIWKDRQFRGRKWTELDNGKGKE